MNSQQQNGPAVFSAGAATEGGIANLVTALRALHGAAIEHLSLGADPMRGGQPSLRCYAGTQTLEACMTTLWAAKIGNDGTIYTDHIGIFIVLSLI